MDITRHIIVTGTVQRVGYRQFLYENALNLNCSGWVRNRADGTVEAVLSGTANAVSRLLEMARRGPPHALVEAIAVTPAKAIYSQFEIRPTA